MSNLFDQINNLDLNNVLNSFGIYGRKGNGYTIYYSPFRIEKHRSFSVYLWKGQYRWMDNSTKEHGRTVDFLTKYLSIDCLELKRRYENREFGTMEFFYSFEKPINPLINAYQKEKEENHLIQIISVSAIQHPALIQYLSQRNLYDPAIYCKYLKEITYTIRSKKYFALGTQNVLGGYTLRNRYFKGTTNPASFTFFPKNTLSKQPSLLIIEGIFDYLSLLHAINSDLELPINLAQMDVLILNSVVHKKSSMTKIASQYPKIYIVGDNDQIGKECIEYFEHASENQFQDLGSLIPNYNKYKDLNEWWCSWKRRTPVLSYERNKAPTN